MSNKINSSVVLRWSVPVIIFMEMVFVWSSFRWAKVDITDVSRRYPPLIRPAGYAFSIWSVIYLWQMIALVANAVRPYGDVDDSVLYCLVGTFTMEALWSVAVMSYDKWRQVSAFSLIFASVFLLFLALKGRVWCKWFLLVATRCEISRSSSLRLVIGLHLGWLMAAFCVSLSGLAVVYGASIGMQTAVAISALMSLPWLSVLISEPCTALGTMWALAAMSARHYGASETKRPIEYAISWSTRLYAMLLGVVAVFVLAHWYNKCRPKPDEARRSILVF